jgi:alpha-tubulin suppressor-like RCC1 family protein
MELRKSSGLLACAGLLLATLLSGCGGSSSNTTIPATATTFFAHSAVFLNATTLLTTGYNGFGQLGNGNLKSQAVLQKVAGMRAVDLFALGADHTLALPFANVTTVYAWGSNYHGQIGNGVTTTGSAAYSATPLSVHGFGGTVKEIAAGAFHSLAVVDQPGAPGSVMAWGYNGFGQLGNSSFVDSAVPVSVVSGALTVPLSGVTKVAASGSHSLALISPTGNVYSWGYNQSGQLGRAANLILDSTPGLVLVPSISNDRTSAPVPLSGVVQIAAGGSSSYALDGNGNVWAWGYNAGGQLGQDPTVVPNSALPYQINFGSLLASGEKVEQISAGNEHVLARTSSKRLLAWGLNHLGQVGINDNSAANLRISTPVLVKSAVRATATPGTGDPFANVMDIFAQGNYSLAKIASNGSDPEAWWAWGDNGFGQLGNTVSTSSIGYLLIPAKMLGYP